MRRGGAQARARATGRTWAEERELLKAEPEGGRAARAWSAAAGGASEPPAAPAVWSEASGAEADAAVAGHGRRVEWSQCGPLRPDSTRVRAATFTGAFPPKGGWLDKEAFSKIAA